MQDSRGSEELRARFARSRGLKALNTEMDRIARLNPEELLEYMADIDPKGLELIDSEIDRAMSKSIIAQVGIERVEDTDTTVHRTDEEENARRVKQSPDDAKKVDESHRVTEIPLGPSHFGGIQGQLIMPTEIEQLIGLDPTPWLRVTFRATPLREGNAVGDCNYCAGTYGSVEPGPYVQPMKLSLPRALPISGIAFPFGLIGRSRIRF